MMNQKKPKNHPVFQYVTIVFFIWMIVCPGTDYAQTDGIDQWRNSVRSLTIFQPGDAVRITVWDLQSLQKKAMDFSGDYPINPEGYIIMPIVGEVQVKGLTLFELEQTLEDRFKDHLPTPLVYVRPLIRITLQGAFNKPGSYHADPSSSLWDVVALADGPGPGCNLERMRVERGGKVAIRDILGYFEKGISLEEVGIESGDQIIAPTRGALNIHFLLALVNFFTSLTLLYLRLRSGSW
jgi:protein involved in polysaccharide export with SLBB domain